ncbi:outer membrane protein assembly factor BamB family protein [Pseudactinotalea suaedae]|uniref:outer membrane protein assembly factor BamB family protein n=1 Tax=Pseudactinotalea suaedae TaxID=1524924 RepID=UPI00139111B0|nr:PQQ-binding-like beta-propeller repeat protein [Pseudactinotalea suaedae]
MADVDEFDLAEERRETDARPVQRSRHGPWFWTAWAVVLVVVGAGAAPDRPLPLGAGTEQTPRYGILDVDLTVAPAVAWSVGLDAVTAAGWPPLQRVGDVVIAVTDPVTGFDVATGEPRWQLGAPAGVCSITTRVVCTTRSGADGVVTVLDPATGDTEVLRIPGAVHAIALDGGLVVAADVDGGHLMAFDDDGQMLWDTPFEGAAVDSDDGGGGRLLSALVDHLLVVGGGITYAVDTRTGELQPGTWAVWTSALGVGVELAGVEDPRHYWVSSDGEVTTRAEALPMQVDDGVGGDVQIDMVGPLLRATDAEGRELWTLPGEDDADDDRLITFALARLAGVVMTAGVGDDVTVSGHDQLTGDELWRLPAGSWPDTFAGAGTTLLRLSADDAFAALDIRTGDELWRHRLGDVIAVVATPDGATVLTEDALTRLVWPCQPCG